MTKKSPGERWSNHFAKCWREVGQMQLADYDRVRIMEMICHTHRIVAEIFFDYGLEAGNKFPPLRANSKYGSDKLLPNPEIGNLPGE